MNKPFPIIEIRQQDWIPGFAAFLSGSTKVTGKAHVLLNLGSFIAAVQTGDIPASEVPYAIAESVMHEVMHVLEEWAGVEFSEERVEALTDAYAAKYGKSEDEGLSADAVMSLKQGLKPFVAREGE